MQVIEKIRQYKSSFLMAYDLETDALCKQPNCIEFMQNSLSNKALMYKKMKRRVKEMHQSFH